MLSRRFRFFNCLDERLRLLDLLLFLLDDLLLLQDLLFLGHHLLGGVGLVLVFGILDTILHVLCLLFLLLNLLLLLDDILPQVFDFGLDVLHGLFGQSWLLFFRLGEVSDHRGIVALLLVHGIDLLYGVLALENVELEDQV